MKRLIYKGVILAMLFFIVGQANAQFTLSGELRPRTELSHGYSELAAQNQDASLFTSQRTRLNLQYSTDKIKTKLKDNLGLIRRNYEIVNVQPGFIPNIYSYTGFNEDFFDFFGADSVKYFIKDYL